MGFMFIVAILVTVTGCSGQGQVSVHGDITLDGSLVESGSISFLPLGSGAEVAVSAPIVNGSYETSETATGLTPGEYRVEITWPKKTGKKIASLDPGMMTDETVEAIPAKYNSESELTVQVTAGKDKYDFALESE